MTVEQEQVIAAAVESIKREAPSPDVTAPVESEIKKPKLMDSRDAPEAAFQIKLGNLSKHIFPKDVKKFLTSKEIKFSRCRKNPKQDFGIVGFETEEDRKHCKETLNDFVWKGKALTVKPWVASSDFGGSRERKERSDEQKPRPAKPVSDKPPVEQIADQVTPLWRLSYAEQLDEKMKRFRTAGLNFKRKMFDLMPRGAGKKNVDKIDEITQVANGEEKAPVEEATEDKKVSEPAVQVAAEGESRETEEDKRARVIEELEWMFEATKVNDKVLCPLAQITPSPVEKYYRNKCEFSFGLDTEDKPSVGFLLGLYKDGVTTVIPPTECLHVKEEAKAIVALLQGHVQVPNAMPVYNRVSKEGFWRLAMVRTFESGETMVLVQVHPGSLTPEKLQEEKIALKTLFESLTKVRVDSLLFQVSDAMFNGFKEETESELILGSTHIHETLLGLQFRVSTTAFFQVNTKAAEVLYATIKERIVEANSGNALENVVLLDLCCGTGTIGLTLAGSVKKVIGIEMVKEAIQDAEYNAAKNGISNVEYLCGKVEDCIGEVFSQRVLPSDTVIAILDPARAGLGSSVMQSLRAASRLNHLVYVACDAENATQNFVE